MRFPRPVLPLLLVLSLGVPCWSAPEAPKARVEMVPASHRYRNGVGIPVLFRFKIQPGWHTYWTNPGTAGEPARVDWELPKGWKTQGLQFPVPDRFQDGDVVILGYQGAVTLLDVLMPPRGIPARSVTLTAHLSWLACKDVCLGEEKTFHLVLRPGDPGPLPRDFRDAGSALPLAWPGAGAVLRRNWLGRWLLTVNVPPGADPAGRFVFIPSNPIGVDLTAEPQGRFDGKTLSFPLRIQRNLLEGGRVEGVLQQVQTRGGWLISAALPDNGSAWLWAIPLLMLLGGGAWLILKGRGK